MLPVSPRTGVVVEDGSQRTANMANVGLVENSGADLGGCDRPPRRAGAEVKPFIRLPLSSFPTRQS
jgi:hypothetical protein